MGVEDVVLCGNGIEVFEIVMMGVGVGQGDVVFIFVFIYNVIVSVVLMVGVIFVFVDVFEGIFNMDVVDLEIKVEVVVFKGEFNFKMVVFVDLFGLLVDYNVIQKVVDVYNLWVLVDGVQVFGGCQDGCFVGNIVDMIVISFFFVKFLGCYGDGGVIFMCFKEEGDVW